MKLYWSLALLFVNTVNRHLLVTSIFTTQQRFFQDYVSSKQIKNVEKMYYTYSVYQSLLKLANCNNDDLIVHFKSNEILIACKLLSITGKILYLMYV